MFSTTFFICTALIALFSYLLGSVNCAIIVSQLHSKDDVRLHGSGNAGMTNMLRTYGAGPASLTAAGDFLKAVVAVLLARLVFHFTGLSDSIPLDAGYIAGLFVLLGHIFPIYFKFKGGKGVMTTLGVMLMVNPIAFLIIAIIFIPLVFLTRIVSLGSVLGSIAFPFVTWGVRYFQGRVAVYDTIGAGIISVIVIYLHRENIKRLLSRTENKFGGKSKK